MNLYKLYFKRFFDFCISLVALLGLSPFLILVLIILIVSNRGNPFYFQFRPGLNEKIFKLIKFKSMTDKRNEFGELLPDSLRITAFGKFLRNYSIDELPQLINVLKGDMSLIGPRPLLVKYLDLYSTEQKKRHLVRPGITGWAQINGRNSISWNEKFELDIYYVNNLTFKLDLIIFIKTIIKVLKKSGINQSDSRPMTPFTGNN
ncbi:sugar transferase [Flavihumibacter cheonanensis]|uniref:sugar transferase n=1 Tax=Flavihumibacter cheonanensis TaxID=1442385 RepID=UPI001EF89C97|nr:sugar transferase [Flavihumibacter cheonanensis]MCG7753876.1 sugar transferase [Flavihumibacter cheonanensis]